MWTLIAIFTLGGTAASAAPQPNAEASFLPIPSATGAQETSVFINEGSHYPGTAGDYRLAVYMRDRMHAFGLRAWIESLSATVYTPRVLQL